MVDRNKQFKDLIALSLSEFEDIRQAIDISKKDQTVVKSQQDSYTEVLLFFSFDIVNSTAYKTIDYMGWARVLNTLFKDISNKVNLKIENAELWRLLGDEIIFIAKVDNQAVLGQYVDRIFQILVETVNEIKKGAYINLADKKEDKKKLLQNILSLKATAWIASVTDIGNVSQEMDELEVADPEYENISEHYKDGKGHDILEFMGNDIDAGFRIAKHTQDGRLVLSFELAYLLYKLGGNNIQRLHIITYKKLKGIWKDKFYPIIWYHDQNAYPDGELKFEDSFSFDAYEENELAREYFDNRDEKCENRIIRHNKMFEDIPYAFEKILKDRRLEGKLKKLQDDIDNQSNRSILHFES